MGEVLLTVVVIIIFSLLSIRLKKALTKIIIGMAILFTLDVSITPSFIPETGVFSQIIKIACISPWAFIGFESVSHGKEEFNFKHSKIFRILVVAVAMTTVLYVCIMILSVTAYPPEYASWLDYIKMRLCMKKRNC